MELRQYLTLLRRWGWLLALGLMFGGSAGYIASQYQIPVYQASTRILVTRAPQDKSSDLTYLTDQQLTQTYVQLLTTQPVLDAASQQLVYRIDPDLVRVQPITNTQIIRLSFEDSDPGRAAAAANTLVQVLIGQNENLQTGRYAITEESLGAQIRQIQNQIDALQSQIDHASTQAVQDQITEVESQINGLQAEISGLEQGITTLSASLALEPAEQASLDEKRARIAQIKPVLTLYQQIYTNLVVLGKPVSSGSTIEGTQLSQLQTTLGLYQQIYINLLNSLETVKLARLQNTPNVVQIEPAVAPPDPIRPRPLLNSLLAGAIGLLLAAGVAFLIEYLDDTLKTPEDVERVLGLSVIGFIAKMDYPVKGERGMYVVKQPRSPVSEAFRSLRTNLEFSSVDKPLRTILVTSASPGEGKTTVAVNLAASIAQGGKSVILLDTDMRRPQVHSFLNVTNRMGLSDLFRSNLSLRMVGQELNGLKDAAVITSGSLPPNPTELLGSDRMLQVLTDLKSAAEIVVLDSPPSMVADAQVLAARVDGVILIVHPAHTHADAAVAAAEQMKRAGAHILGVVMNRIPRDRSYYYSGYQYYSPYSPVDGEKTRPRTEAPGRTRPQWPALNRIIRPLAAWIESRRRLKTGQMADRAWNEQMAALSARKTKAP